MPTASVDSSEKHVTCFDVSNCAHVQGKRNTILEDITRDCDFKKSH